MSEPTVDPLATALVAALAELTDPPKDGAAEIRHGQTYAYLTLPTLLQTARTTLGAHGIAVLQWSERTEQGVAVTTLLLHSTGARLEFPPLELACPPGAQAMGSAITYARRYSLAAALGLAGSDDDDGKASVSELTKPVERVKGRPGDPANDPWKSAPPDPADPREYPDIGAPTRSQGPSRAQVRMLWALLRGTDMTEDQVRTWVAGILDVDEGWHTADLTAAQVSILIDRLNQGTVLEPETGP